MGALTALVLSVAAVDSLNPSTVAPALYLAAAPHALRAVAMFTLGVWTVSTIGGLVLLFGPGRSLLPLITKPTPHTRHVIEVAVGGVLLLASVLLWFLRARVFRPHEPTLRGRHRASLLLGAGIMAVELPTAFPYFAAILAIVGSGHTAAAQASLVLLYNVVFVAPLLALLVLVQFAGVSAARRTENARRLLETYAPLVVPIGIGAIGAGLVVLGVLGLTA